TFPTTVTEADLLTVTYYDDYSFVNYTGWDAEGLAYEFEGGRSGLDNSNTYPSEIVQLATPTGQVTGGKTRVFGQTTWLNNVVYYDEKYRVIQSVQEHLLSGTDRIFNRYNFRGLPLGMLREHTRSGSNPLIYEQTYQYDHGERLITATHQLEGEDQVTLSQHEYNELSELVDKQLHSSDGTTFTQSVDYRYNIRGWLESINNSALSDDNGVTNDEDDDYFGMELHYENPVNQLPTPRSFLPTPPSNSPSHSNEELIRQADELIRQQFMDYSDKPTSQQLPEDSLLQRPKEVGLLPMPDVQTLTAGPGIVLPASHFSEVDTLATEKERQDGATENTNKADSKPLTFDQRLLVNFTDALETYGVSGWNNMTSPASGTSVSLVDDSGTG
ncbi:MAG: hypothetical protein AAF223_21185, partial [Bacteroidota bacterium]